MPATKSEAAGTRLAQSFPDLRSVPQIRTAFGANLGFHPNKKTTTLAVAFNYPITNCSLTNLYTCLNSSSLSPKKCPTS